MYNYKLIFFCQRCKKEHDRTHEPMFETGVKCDCGGFVITPSGRTTMQIRLTADVYIIVGEKYITWIGSKTEDDARTFFYEKIEDKIVAVQKMSHQEIAEAKFVFNPKNSEDPADFVWCTAKELLIATENLPFLIYGIDIELYEEARRKHKKDNNL